MLPTSLHIPAFARVTDYVGPWAMEETAINALLSHAKGIDLRQHVAESLAMPKTELRSAAEMLPDGKGKSVAVLRVEGTLMKAGSSLGGTGTVQMRRDIRKAAADGDVSAIMLVIDSPGGTVAGTDDLAAEVKAATKRKPVMAYVQDLCASAAYWVASQADKIVANSNTAMIGSIGTFMTAYDMSKKAETEGVEALVFATGSLKGAGAAPGSPISEEQRAHFQGIVNESQKTFDAAVKSGRGMSDKQLSTVRSGGVFHAQEALKNGLIDDIQPFESAFAELVKESRNPGRARASAEHPRGLPMSVDNDPVALIPDHVATMRKQLAAEAERAAAIHAVCSKTPDIAAKAIAEGWSVEKAELTSMKASLPANIKAANPHAGPTFIFGAGKHQTGSATVGNNVPVNTAIECALHMSLGRPNTEKHYTPDALQAANDNFKRLRLQQVLMLAAMENGYAASPAEKITQSNLRAVLQHAFGGSGGLMASGVSNMTVSGILSNVGNKEIREGYMESDTAWQQISVVKPVNDFKQVTSYRMLDDMEYEELAPDGKIQHGTTNEESYTRQAKTYARMFALTRTDIINDDLGAFADMRNRIGRGSSMKLNKVFWTKFMTNLGTTFTAGRTNYISGSTTNLGTDGVGLSLGVKAFRTMTSPATDGSKRVNADTANGGYNPGGRPEILLVSPELEGAAEVLYRNQNLGAVKGSDANIHQNKYRPVVAWQLSNSSYTGNSATQWFLFNNPLYMAPMVVSFLDGQQAPTVDMADADFNQLGIQFRGYHDFGCDVAEYLAGIMSKGAA